MYAWRRKKHRNALNAENGSSFFFVSIHDSAEIEWNVFERRHRLVRSILKCTPTLSLSRARDAFIFNGFFLLLSSLVGNNKYQVFNGLNYTIIKEKRL